MVSTWNVLPEELVEADTMAAFKKHWDEYMNRKGIEEYKSFHFWIVMKIVDRIDQDKDGLVTAEELITWIKRAQNRYIDENVNKNWKEYDSNRDGKVSWEEYKNATYGFYL
eukprot:g18323.t1